MLGKIKPYEAEQHLNLPALKTSTSLLTVVCYLSGCVGKENVLQTPLRYLSIYENFDKDGQHLLTGDP